MESQVTEVSPWMAAIKHLNFSSCRQSNLPRAASTLFKHCRCSRVSSRKWLAMQTCLRWWTIQAASFQELAISPTILILILVRSCNSLQCSQPWLERAQWMGTCQALRKVTCLWVSRESLLRCKTCLQRASQAWFQRRISWLIYHSMQGLLHKFLTVARCKSDLHGFNGSHNLRDTIFCFRWIGTS